MELDQLIQLINGKILSRGHPCNCQIKGCCGADLMSDVLATIQPHALLLTGLCNPQIVRTAQMADVSAIVIVRGKIPPKETVDLAIDEGILLISSPYGMYDLCGRLYQAGLPSFESPVATGYPS